MSTALIVSAAAHIISYERPTATYVPSRPPTHSKFLKNWTTMDEIRQDRLVSQQSRIGSLIAKLNAKSANTDIGIALIHRLRIQAMILGLFGLNSHFREFLDEDILVHPGWASLDIASRPVAEKFGEAIRAFADVKRFSGDKLFNQADEMFGRLRHAIWSVSTTFK